MSYDGYTAGNVSTETGYPKYVASLIVSTGGACKVHVAFIDRDEYDVYDGRFHHNWYEGRCGRVDGYLVTVPLGHLNPSVLCKHCRPLIEDLFDPTRTRTSFQEDWLHNGPRPV